jgi:hypothetical protein
MSTGACYDATPQASPWYGEYYGWIYPLSYGQTSNPGASIWFSTFDGQELTTYDGGVTYVQTTCGAPSTYCYKPPTTSTSCFYDINGNPLTCSAGQYCYRGGTNPFTGKTQGACYTACKQTSTEGGCGCDLNLLPATPTNGQCDSKRKRTTTGVCVLPNTDSSCVN